MSLCLASGQLEDSEARRAEAESLQKTLSQELENAQIELENICKHKSLASVPPRVAPLPLAFQPLFCLFFPLCLTTVCVCVCVCF